MEEFLAVRYRLKAAIALPLALALALAPASLTRLPVLFFFYCVRSSAGLFRPLLEEII